MAKGNTEAALADFERAVPQTLDSELVLTVARLYLNGPAPNRGLELCKRVMTRDPGLYTPYEGIYTYFKARGAFAELRDFWLGMVQEFPDRGLAHFALGVAYEHLGQPAYAIASYETAHTLAPDGKGTRENLSRLLCRQALHAAGARHWGKALAAALRANALDPESMQPCEALRTILAQTPANAAEIAALSEEARAVLGECESGALSE